MSFLFLIWCCTRRCVYVLLVLILFELYFLSFVFFYLIIFEHIFALSGFVGWWNLVGMESCNLLWVLEYVVVVVVVVWLVLIFFWMFFVLECCLCWPILLFCLSVDLLFWDWCDICGNVVFVMFDWIPTDRFLEELYDFGFLLCFVMFENMFPIFVVGSFIWFFWVHIMNTIVLMIISWTFYFDFNMVYA